MKENILDQLAIKYDTDKSSKFHYYTKYYDEFFKDKRNDISNLLEIGVYAGASHRMWKEYFPNATIYGIDINENCKKHEEDRIKIIIADQVDSSIPEKYFKDIEFDIIIDDGHHSSYTQVGSFELYWPLLKSNGFYIIEDLHCNLIQNDFAGISKFILDRFININLDGKSNMGNYELSINNLLNNDQQLSRYAKEIESIHFYQHIMILRKR